MGQMSGSVFKEKTHVTAEGVNDFIDQIEEKVIQQIEGDNFGAPFRLDFYSYLDEKYLSYISGYFYSAGMQFDEDRKLPDGAALPSVAGGGGSGSSGSSTKPFTGKADADTTKDITNNGKISDDHIKQTMGSNFGKKPFDITLTDGSENKVGQVVGGFNKDGTIIDDKKTEIPKPCRSSPASPAASSIAAPPVTLRGSGDGIKSQLNNQSYDYIYKATGGKYGPFYITFESSDGKIRGYIKGTISNNSYSYKWSYTYQG